MDVTLTRFNLGSFEDDGFTILASPSMQPSSSTGASALVGVQTGSDVVDSTMVAMPSLHRAQCTNTTSDNAAGMDAHTETKPLTPSNV